jgi:probable HAF family extracellular repeat protein
MERTTTAISAILALCGSCSALLAQPFPVTGIGNLSGGPSIAWAISNGSGQPVVGETDTNNNLNHKACTFTTGMLATNTGSGPGGFFTPQAAYRISTTNLIYCGSGQSASISTRAFRNYGGTTTELGTINPFLQNSEARGVNNNGTIVGTCWAMNYYPGSGGGNSYAFSWTPTNPGTPTSTAGTLAFIPLHAAYDINDSNLVVGQLNGLPYQLNLNTSALASMGSLGGSLAGAALSNNNAGAAVGYSPATSGFRHAFRWTSGGGMQDIHPAVLASPPVGESFAYDVNASGLVVGTFYAANTGANGHAFIYNPASGLWRDLNTWLPSGSGWVLEVAYGISDNTCVVGRGKHNGQTEGFKMCVIPPALPPLPCPGGPLTPIPNQFVCPGGTVVFDVDASTVGATPATPATVEWDYVAGRAPAGMTHEYHRVMDGVNTDPQTGEPIFVASFGGGGTVGGTSLTMTSIASPGGGGVGGGGGGWTVRALVHGPCDTMYTNAATAFVAPADVGGQGGMPGGDGAYDNNDFVVYIDKFFTGDPVADVGVQGGALGSDGLYDNNDFVVFIDLFFHACS